MRNALQRALVGLLAAGVLAVPAVAQGQVPEQRSASPQASPATYRYPVVDRDRRMGRDLDVVGLTADRRLVRFDAANPRRTRDIGWVRGLVGDQMLVGIDHRVQDGKLYGVGNAGGIYTISSRSAVATKVSQLTVALSGTSFGVDFNPAANRLRVISDTGQNLRHNIDDPMGLPAAGTTAVDGTLTYPPATAAATGVSGAAHTNSDLDASTATTLLDVDTNLDQVAIQSPANAGSLAPTGKLLVDVGPGAGFDIYSRLRDGRVQGNTGYATLQLGGRAAFFQISLLTGQANPVGFFPVRNQVTDIAIPLDQR